MSKPKAKARVFVPLVKVDEEQRLVYGRITQEELDKAGEVMDYTSSKPHFEKWSADIEAASGGLSKGNVRVMHGLTAAGKLTELNFDDEDKAIDVCAKVVDDQEWEKVVEGVYTGFSVGGSYGKRWTDTVNGAKIKKYEAKPNEVSLVDNPCVYSATFSLVKADGAVEDVEFQNIDTEWPGFNKAEGVDDTDDKPAETDEKKEEAPKVEKAADGFTPSNPEIAVKAEELCKAAGDATKDWMDYINPAREALIADHNASLGKNADAAPAEGTEAAASEEDGEAATEPGEAPAGEGAAVSKTTPVGVKQKWEASDGTTFEKKADAEAHELTLEKAEETEVDRLAKALQRVKDGVSGAEEALEPETVFDDLDRLHKAFVELDQPREEDGAPKLEKGMYTVSRFADMLASVARLSKDIKAEGVLEGGDESDENVSEALRASLGSFSENFLTYAKQQVAEMLKGIDGDISPKCCYDYYYRAAQDDSENALAKDVCDLIDSVKDELGEDFDPTEEQMMAKRAPVDSEEGTVPLAKFQALESEHTKLMKIATDAVDQLEGLAKRVAVIEDTPLPRAPNHVVDKAGDSQGPLQKVKTEEEGLALLKGMLDRHGPDNLALMMIKASQSKPQTMGGGR